MFVDKAKIYIKAVTGEMERFPSTVKNMLPQAVLTEATAVKAEILFSLLMTVSQHLLISAIKENIPQKRDRMVLPEIVQEETLPTLS